MTAKKQQKAGKLTEDYQYKGDGKLMLDISASEPLKKSKSKTKKEKVENIEKTEVVEKKIEKIPSRKDVYISMLKENKPFFLKLNGNVVFDSEKNDIMLLCFEDNYFRIGLEKHSYDGLNFKFKK